MKQRKIFENRDVEIVGSARRWLGTRFLHQASVKGLGCDCLGLVRGVWRDCVGKEPCQDLTYSQNWSVSQGHDVLMDAIRNNFEPDLVDTERPGRVLVFRLVGSNHAKHLAISTGQINGVPQMIHSYSTKGVVECQISAAWLRRCLGQFQFPKRIDEWQR